MTVKFYDNNHRLRKCHIEPTQLELFTIKAWRLKVECIFVKQNGIEHRYNNPFSRLTEKESPWYLDDERKLHIGISITAAFKGLQCYGHGNYTHGENIRPEERKHIF